MRDATGGVQSVLVWGGTSEIGLAIARQLVADRTRTVVLAARDPAALSEAAADLRRRGADDVRTVAFDATDTGGHAEVVREIFAGAEVDVVVVAFGVLGDQERAEADVGHALEILETNTVGAASIVLHSHRALTEQGHGTIVVLSSVAGERARRANFVYGASKAGIDAIAQGLSDAVAGSALRVLVVRPGFVRTKMTSHLKAAPFATTAEAVAEAVADGLASGAGTVWVPGILRWVMAVLRHLPRVIFRRLPG